MVAMEEQVPRVE